MVNHNIIELIDDSHDVIKTEQKTYFVNLYLDQLGPLIILESNEEEKLINNYKSGDGDAFKKLILYNQYIVIKEVLRVANQNIDLMDLIQFGNIALIQSLKSENIVTTGFKSYLHRNIYRRLQNQILNHFSFIRYPLNRIDELFTFRDFFLNDLINQSVLVNYLDKPEKINDHESEDEIISYNYKLLSMLYLRCDNFDSDCYYYNHLLDQNQFDNSLSIEIAGQLMTLKDKESTILKMYFGLGRDYTMTLNEIGEEFNLTRERVRQIKEKAIKKLAHSERKKQLEPIYSELINRSESPYYKELKNGWLLDPYSNFEINNEEGILLLKEYIKSSLRDQYIEGVPNLTKHYQKIIKGYLKSIGRAASRKEIRKRIRKIDKKVNKTMLDYAINSSKELMTKGNYVALRSLFG